jgi:citrate synthase
MSAPVAEKYPNYSPGLEGVVAGISKISEIDSDRSSLQYRGYDVHDLAERGSYEETAYLLLKGSLPTQEELAEFNKLLAAEREVPSYIYDILKSLPKNTHPMDMVCTAY